MRLIVGISGATGSLYGVRLLEVLKEKKIETHLIITSPAKEILLQETSYSIKEIEGLASYVYDDGDLGASISSGSFKMDGMVVIPCSIKTLSGIAHSYNENLLTRAADVTLKERRKLILVVRETPFHQGHIELMLQASRMGAILFPPMPAFYTHPKTIDDLINHTVGKILDLFGIDHDLFVRWGNSSLKKVAKKKR
ncbi:MAG: 3-octaprenyl-4-hydroxybenzoate carboxy-lyase [Deltaproteobacteria bacterium RBG_16_47_11]|nr:MAG: 3-octaprenyl-4-hydroxybenzoate carboxy-lyase [Deltaproteobacteria bacterium RBG_16_47_11]